MQLNGTLSQFPLIDVIQFIGQSKKGGELLLLDSARKPISSIFFHEGKLVHSLFRSQVEGIEAVELSLKESDEGYFEFISGREAAKHTIEKAADLLILECQSRIDELRNLQKALPADDTILFLNPVVEIVPNLNTMEWKVISLVNGRNSIERICRKSGDELETKRALSSLLGIKLVLCQDPGSAWKSLVPQKKTSSEVNADRPYPPLLRTNLLLNQVDGESSLANLLIRMKAREHEFLQDIRLLFETNWISFRNEDTSVFSKLKEEW